MGDTSKAGYEAAIKRVEDSGSGSKKADIESAKRYAHQAGPLGTRAAAALDKAKIDWRR